MENERAAARGEMMVKDLQATFREYMVLERQRTSSELSVSELARWTELKRMLNRKFQPELGDDEADRRESIRVPVNLRVSFVSYGEVGRSLMTNLSRGGLFIKTPEPMEIGTPIELRVQVGDSQNELTIPGKVVSVNSGGSRAAEAGMGVRFNELSPEQQKGVDELYEQSAVSRRK
jgi:uncharacterized protein (TIGR02266 family)